MMLDHYGSRVKRHMKLRIRKLDWLSIWILVKSLKVRFVKGYYIVNLFSEFISTHTKLVLITVTSKITLLVFLVDMTIIIFDSEFPLLILCLIDSIYLRVRVID